AAALIDDTALRAQDAPARLGCAGDLADLHVGVGAAREADDRLGVVLIRDVVPDMLVEEAGHVLHRARRDPQHPVDEVRAPVIKRPAGDLLVGAPPAAGVAPAAAVRLDVKHFANDTPIDDVSDGPVIAIPAAVVKGGA